MRLALHTALYWVQDQHAVWHKICSVIALGEEEDPEDRMLDYSQKYRKLA
jgi:hypothetical protein